MGIRRSPDAKGLGFRAGTWIWEWTGQHANARQHRVIDGSMADLPIQPSVSCNKDPCSPCLCRAIVGGVTPHTHMTINKMICAEDSRCARAQGSSQPPFTSSYPFFVVRKDPSGRPVLLLDLK
jgi:hypothetical protein